MTLKILNILSKHGPQIGAADWPNSEVFCGDVGRPSQPSKYLEVLDIVRDRTFASCLAFLDLLLVPLRTTTCEHSLTQSRPQFVSHFKYISLLFIPLQVNYCTLNS